MIHNIKNKVFEAIFSGPLILFICIIQTIKNKKHNLVHAMYYICSEKESQRMNRLEYEEIQSTALEAV